MGAETPNVTEPLTPPADAVSVTEPVRNECTTPEASTTAIVESEVVQRVVGVRSAIDPSLKTPVTDSERGIPAGVDAVAGDTVMDASCAATTVNPVVPVIPLRTARTVTGPGET